MTATAPGSDDQPADLPDDHLDDGTGASRSRAWLLPVGTGLALVALAAGLLLGRGLASAQGVERVTDPVSLGFVRDMTTHHAQAVRMSEIVHRRSPDPEISYLAFDILSTQQGQIGIMAGWLRLWQQPPGSDEPTMAWMGHDGPMPGLAPDAEVASLDTLPVPQMEERFLRLMIRHHAGAVPMADAAAAAAEDPHTAALAASMSTGQQSEIDLMQRLLTERGLAPEPVPAGSHSGSAGHGNASGSAGHGSAPTPAPSAAPTSTGGHAGH